MADARGGVAELQYDDAAQAVTHLYRRANQVERRVYTLDPAGHLKGFTTSESAVRLAYERNGLGKITTADYYRGSDRLGRVRYAYDRGGNRQRKILLLGGEAYSSQFAYDANGRLTRARAPRARALEMEYNPAGFLRWIRRGASSETELRANAAAETEGFFHRADGPPRLIFSDVVTEWKDQRPAQRRFLAQVFKDPEQFHLQRTENSFAKDGKLWRSVVQDEVTSGQGTRIQVTQRTAYQPTGRPVEMEVETQVLRHRELAGKRAVARTTFQYRPDGKLRTLTRTATDMDGNRVEFSRLSFDYDAAGNMTRKASLFENPERKILREQISFQYDAFNRLVSQTFWHSNQGEATRELKRVRFEYGPAGELLKESREYVDSDLGTYVEGQESLKGRPNPLFYLHDQGVNEALITESGGLYLYTASAPGGNYPLAVLDKEGRPHYPHQDEQGTTQFFTDRGGALVRYAPLAEGDQTNPVERAGSVASAHRLGDGALETLWPSYLGQSCPTFRYLGEGLPFDLVPQEPADLTSFTDNEAAAYGQTRLGQLSALEILISVVNVIQYLAPHNLARLIVEGVVDSWKRRYREFSDNGVTFPGAQATNAAIGDFLGYTDLLEAIVGVDSLTSSSLTMGQRWFKGLWGAVSLLTVGMGMALRGVSAARMAKPGAQAARLAQGQHAVRTGWDVALQYGSYLDLSFGVLAVGNSLLAPPQDSHLRNGPSLRTVWRNFVTSVTPWGLVLANRVPVRTPNRRIVPFVDLVRESYHNAYRELFSKGFYFYKGFPWGPHMLAGAEGSLADALVKDWLKAKGRVRRQLNDIGIPARQLDFEVDVSKVTEHNMDILWRQGHFFLDLKRTIGIGTLSPGPAGQFEAFKSFAELRSFYFAYVGAREKATNGSIIRAITPLRRH
jgi:YD repeat-containing protein